MAYTSEIIEILNAHTDQIEKLAKSNSSMADIVQKLLDRIKVLEARSVNPEKLLRK